MAKFLIIESDGIGGRGARGRNLYWFLTTYFGRRNVKIVRSSDLERHRDLTADYLFVGMPSNLAREQLAAVKYDRAFLFDYSECPGPQWREEDSNSWRSVSNVYLKAWVEADWDHGLTFGLLPIRRYAKLPMYLRLLKTIPGQYRLRGGERKYDVSFLGNAAGIVPPEQAGDYSNQRIDWLKEVVANRDRFSFWGGLTYRKDAPACLFEAIKDARELLYPEERAGFPTYFNHLLKSKTSLAPAGNVRWSYRHYEAIYAGSIPVSVDFRSAEMLVPFPVDGMVHVGKGESVLPAIDQALKMRHDQPELAERNAAFLEQYLNNGAYSRKRPLLLERFMEQLDNAKQSAIKLQTPSENDLYPRSAPSASRRRSA